MKLKRLSLVFLFSFLAVLVVLNFAVLWQHVWYASAQIDNPFSDDGLVFASPLDVPGRALPVQDPSASTFRPKLSNEARIVIPKLNVDAPIVLNVENDNDAIYDALEHGVVSHPIVNKPGEGGTTVLLGHSSGLATNNPNLSVFTLIRKLEPGDIFYVQYSNGQRFDYEVEEAFKFNPFDPNDEDLYRLEELDYDNLTMVTCDPPGLDIQRQAVLARQL